MSKAKLASDFIASLTSHPLSHPWLVDLWRKTNGNRLCFFPHPQPISFFTFLSYVWNRTQMYISTSSLLAHQGNGGIVPIDPCMLVFAVLDVFCCCLCLSTCNHGTASTSVPCLHKKKLWPLEEVLTTHDNILQSAIVLLHAMVLPSSSLCYLGEIDDMGGSVSNSSCFYSWR